MNKKDLIKQSAAYHLERHRRKCKICNHSQRKEIEEDYLQCIPYTELAQRWGICYESFVTHGVKTGLWQLRDRKAFYWKIIESCDLNTITCANALEAAKWLDKLENKLNHSSPPANISVIYSFGKQDQPSNNGKN